MKYRTLGKTGRKVSVLGYGCMRLPTRDQGEQFTYPNGPINREEAIRLIRMAIDAGVNYVDTAYNYHDDESERVLGEALKEGYREKVTLETKAPIWKEEYNKPEHFEEHLDEQLEKLQVDCIDVYLLHSLNKNNWKKAQELNLIERAEKAKEEGKINHFGFSFHDSPEVLKEIIDSDWFEVMLVQYNILDQVNEEMIKYAGEKGMGVLIMGPNGGGRLAGKAPENMKKWLTEGRENFVDLAMKFVWKNPHVSVALSGMGSELMVTDNLALASGEKYDNLTEDEKERIEALGTKIKELTEQICTQCRYCQPCPNEVNIPLIFGLMIHSQIYGNETAAKWAYSNIGNSRWFPGKNATACVECGECEPKCPQKIPIIEQLKDAHELLTANE
ncbi:MAG: aldo/keto reductase [Candidatus Heimdallarchaeota archaeon]|nr:aldo/keto reductase [Candidatus Heimdallarchaeota archaeon]